MLKIAIPNKGSLAEGAVELINAAGYKCRPSGRELAIRDTVNNVEFFLIRPRDIAVYVSNGVLDMGITGRDLTTDGKATVDELLALGFGKSRFFYAIPKERSATPDQFGGLRIATSYPAIVQQDMARRGLSTTVIKLDGAVEISIRLGVADAIADVVESGRTLEEAGLKTVGEPILVSEAILIGRTSGSALPNEAGAFISRIKGILLAREYAMVEYDVPETALPKACAITPGIESPTIAPLSEKGWVAVKSMVREKEINRIMDELSLIGAKGIIITDIRTCRM
jgi:ATP phosphoribosyltransferase